MSLHTWEQIECDTVVLIGHGITRLLLLYHRNQCPFACPSTLRGGPGFFIWCLGQRVLFVAWKLKGKRSFLQSSGMCWLLRWSRNPGTIRVAQVQSHSVSTREVQIWVGDRSKPDSVCGRRSGWGFQEKGLY